MQVNQQEICDIAAEVAAEAIGPLPRFLSASARGLAAGLFATAYENASNGQRRKWNKMCERALQKAWTDTFR